MTYRRIWKKAFGDIPKDVDGRSFEIHHIDGNRKNNLLNNLVCLSIEDHFWLHYKKGEYHAAHLISKRMKTPPLKINQWDMTEDKRKKLSEAKRGINNPMKNPLNAQKVADALRGRKKSKEADRKRLETARKNGTLARSYETRLKMKKPKSKVECPHCKKFGGQPQMIRWHFNNCKLKTNE